MRRAFLFILILGIGVSCDRSVAPVRSDYFVGDPNKPPVIRIDSADEFHMSGTAMNIDVREVRVAVWRDGSVPELPSNSLGVINLDGTWTYPATGFNQAVAMLVDPETYQRCSLEIEGVPHDRGVLASEAYPPLE